MAVTGADLTDAFAAMPVGPPPDIVHVVPEIPLSATCRPTASALRTEGVPKASRNAWHLEPDTGKYKRLTAAARAHLCGIDNLSGTED
jgi:putative long chain acyl-CoA synthase